MFMGGLFLMLLIGVFGMEMARLSGVLGWIGFCSWIGAWLVLLVVFAKL